LRKEFKWSSIGAATGVTVNAMIEQILRHEYPAK